MHMLSRRAIVTVIATGIFGLAGVAAEASTISFDQTFNPTAVLMIGTGDVCTGDTAAGTASSSSCKSLQFTFTLDGYVAATDTLASGSLQLFFYDDNFPGPDAGDNPAHVEVVNISLDGVLTSNSPLLIATGSTSSSPFSTAFDVLAQLQNGDLTVLLAPSTLTGNNDFYFASSRLIARGEREELEEEPPPTSQLPEPASLLLFGAAGLGVLVRRRKAAG